MLNQFRKFYTVNQIIVKKSFKNAFGKYLLLTNTVSSGVLLGAGDLVQQEFEFRQKLIPERYDYSRTGRMFLVGLTLGPLHHYFYKYLDLFFPKQDLSTVGKKILVDQFLAGPVFIVSFFYGMGFLENKTKKEMNNELRDKFLTVYVADWCVWPPSQFINFYYISSQYRVLYINFITMIYDVFLSYIKHKDQKNIMNVSTKF